MKTFRKGGIHPDGSKLTSEAAVIAIQMPAELALPLSQAIGAPSKPLVKAGDTVQRGQMIAEAGGFVGAPVHSPVTGTVKKLDRVHTPQGQWQDAIIITPDTEAQDTDPAPLTAEEAEALTPAEIVKAVGDSGIVGLGGATFPTRVKLSPPEGKVPDTIIINGAECEPYLTCDDRLMRTGAAEIISGTRLIMRSVSVSRAIIGIEENKPQAIAAMRDAAAPYSDIEVIVLKKKYPQGGEKQLIQALTGREVPAGGLPVDVGCIVDNVATAYAVHQAVVMRRPLTCRIVTVTGPSLQRPGNYLAPFGTPLSALIEAAGGLPEDTGKVIAGGPMMGRAVSCLDAPSTKGTSGILVLPQEMSSRRDAGPCIRCGRCVDACPMGLEPYLLMLHAVHSRWDDACSRGVMNCIECGCCSYSCPSSRPILDHIKLAKMNLKKR